MANTNVKAIVNNYEAGYAHAELDKLIRKYGTIAVLRYATNGKALEDIESGIVFSKGLNGKVIEVITSPLGKLIPAKEYGGTAENQREKFFKEMEENGIETIMKEAVEEAGLKVWDYDGCYMKVTHEAFADYIVKESGKEIFLDILNIIKSAPSWLIKGRGITRFKMELVYQILMLHENNREAVRRELIKLLNDYDQTNMKCKANDDDEFRHTLDYEAKMIAWTEKQICAALNLKRKFEVAA